MRRVFVLLALVACERQREVTLQLGPTDTTLTVGFVCRQDADPSKLLGERAIVGTKIEFRVIVDLVDFGDVIPGCRGEELLAACPAGRCKIRPRPNGTRFCKTVSFDATLADPDNLGPMLAAIRDDLDDEAVIGNAPARPVMVRALATTEAVDCAAVPDVFDETKLVGCAYSCPVQLDTVDGTLALSLDALSNRCEREVKICAQFPF